MRAALQQFLEIKEFQQMSHQKRMELLERRECIPAYKGPCNPMGPQFMIVVSSLLGPAWAPAFVLTGSDPGAKA